MARKFEVGKKYTTYQSEFGEITILRRTDKTIWVENDSYIHWKMRIKRDADSNEYVVDSAVPLKWRDAFTYMA